MQLIYQFISLALLLLNIAGLTVLTRRWIASSALARSIGLIGFCLLLFFIEHFYGFGRLNWLWPFSSAIAAYLLYRQRTELTASGFWRSEWLFYAVFFYVFAWRYAFPSIYPSSEHVSDLYFITNYLDGMTLPPPDRWYPPYRFDFYYAFQHYAAALLGRIFNYSPGMTYNVAFALILALPATLAWEWSGHYLKRRGLRILLLVTLVSGGTGMSPLLYFVQPSISRLPAEQQLNAVGSQIVASQRFIGLMDNDNLSRFGKLLFPPTTRADDPKFAPRQLPEETYGYQIYLGDYHPPAGGFVLLTLMLALIGAIENSRIGRLGQGLLGATLPLVMITNTWVLPLQAILIGAWIAYRYWLRRPPDWPALVLGGLSGTLLIYPFLTGFVANVQHTAVRVVSSVDHTPWRRFLGLHWPLLVLIGLSLVNPSRRRLNLSLALAILGMLFMSEFLFVDDPTGAQYERTNTTMKWWGWIWTAGLVSLGTLNLASTSRTLRWIAISVMLLVSSYVIDLGRYYIEADKQDAGHLEGHYWLTRNKTNADLLRFLQHAPKGIVLENQYGEAYNNTGIYSVFSDKPVLLGWPMEINTWHHNAIDIYPLKNQIISFYKGELADKLRWLEMHQVRYIVWSGDDNKKKSDAFDKIQASISSGYYWHELYQADNYHVGLWIARQPKQ